MRVKKPSLKTYNMNQLCKESNNIDGHIHTASSPDANLTIEEVIKEAKERNLSHIAITDHNTCAGVDNYMRSLGLSDDKIYFQQDGIKVACGAEITCYYSHSAKKKQKLHILCYGFNRDPNNPFMRLLRDKYEDYLETFFTIPETLVKYGNENYGKVYSRDDFKNYVFDKLVSENSSIHDKYTWEEVIDYFSNKGFSSERLKLELLRLRNLFKTRDNIILNVKSVIDAVHKAGGKCMIAHPLKSFKKFSDRYNHNKIQRFSYAEMMTNTLLKMGVDGVELISYTNDDIKETYNALYQNVKFTSYGSDKHTNSKDSIQLGQIHGYNPPCNFKYVIEKLQADQSSNFSNSANNLTKRYVTRLEI